MPRRRLLEDARPIPIPLGDGQRVGVRLDAGLLARLDVEATRQGLSRSEAALQALDRSLPKGGSMVQRLDAYQAARRAVNRSHVVRRLLNACLH